MMAASIDERQFSNQRSVPREIPREPAKSVATPARPRRRCLPEAPQWRGLLLPEPSSAVRRDYITKSAPRQRWQIDEAGSRRAGQPRPLGRDPRLRQPAEAPGAKAPEADPVWERLDDRRAHGRRHDDLHRDGRFRIIRRERAPSTTRVRWPRLVHSERVARIDRHASFQAKGAAGGAAAECDSWRPAAGWSVDRRDRVA